mmetsp:Transcript_47037/g.102361  ORF Transcript_47037/g.102361 Transcript_47037/m.102361 type:complete len:314 (+) Transcript_47037:89-1030(+)
MGAPRGHREHRRGLVGLSLTTAAVAIASVRGLATAFTPGVPKTFESVGNSVATPAYEPVSALPKLSNQQGQNGSKLPALSCGLALAVAWLGCGLQARRTAGGGNSRRALGVRLCANSNFGMMSKGAVSPQIAQELTPAYVAQPPCLSSVVHEAAPQAPSAAPSMADLTLEGLWPASESRAASCTMGAHERRCGIATARRVGSRRMGRSRRCAHRASAASSSTAERRRVGAKLVTSSGTRHFVELERSYDQSRVPTKMQMGLRVASRSNAVHNREVGAPSSTNLLGTATDSRVAGDNSVMGTNIKRITERCLTS